MKAAKAKYRFYGEELSRVKNLLAVEPYGKQAEKRKREVSELETKVSLRPSSDGKGGGVSIARLWMVSLIMINTTQRHQMTCINTL